RPKRKSSSGLSRAGDSTRHGAAAEAAETRRQKQAPETASLPTFAPRDRWRCISKFRRRQELGSSEQDSFGRILSDFTRRHETIFPNCGRTARQRKLGRAERRAE